MITPRKALNPAYRKHKVLRKDINAFTEQLTTCLNAVKLIDEKGESEEHIKQPIQEFLKNTFYSENYINTKDRIDLAIYSGKTIKSELAVIIEAKRPSNKAEFPSSESINKKALQELLLYYLRERIDEKNNNIKHLIATNGYEWYLFKSEDFYTYFYKNKALVKEYEAFRDGNKDSSKNELFYKEIASKYIAEAEKKLPFVYLNFTKTSIAKYSDADLNTLFKIFSDVHILGTSFGNDSNQLNKAFYNELLHIIGLEETKVKGKKLINRKPENKRDYGSLLENTIFVLEDRNYLRNIRSIPNNNDKAFHAGLELSLTWINRILFLKLLESQLLAYHNKAKEHHFLNSEFINGFDDLNDLFFSALAKKTENRHPKYKERFKNIPYLNSSLFERNKLENEAFTISALNDDEIHIFSQTVLKDAKGNRIKGKLKTLDYLFRFLDAYDFATDGTEEIEDAKETKTLINASVLGLIFEKINGYKEGSFYTPAYITMYMSRETLRRAVVQKFKELENNQIESFQDLKDYCAKFFKREDRTRFNKIINSLKIVDPAVGSGHFLVSALNELLAIKNDLDILTDSDGNKLKCEIRIDNDELFISDYDGNFIEYKPQNSQSSIIQKALFHEKQTIIENCLFGVDINPNSVKICRLRLWIELLKNAYYTQDNQLQTLPNIDINIKKGNSLISRFGLDEDLSNALKKSKWTIESYKIAVETYRNATNKDEKWEMRQLIADIKSDFKAYFSQNDPLQKKLQKMENELRNIFEQGDLFGEEMLSKKQLNDRNKKIKLLEKEIPKVEAAIEEKKNNKIYRNAFEWRFEFPEVLDDNGNYIGFDVVIGNPPYVSIQSLGRLAGDYGKFGFKTYTRTGDLYALFYELGHRVQKVNGLLCFITGSAWMRTNYGTNLRKFFMEETAPIQLIDFSDCEIFDSATVLTNIMMYEKTSLTQPIKSIRITRKDQHNLENLETYFKNNHIEIIEFPETSWIISDKQTFEIKNKVENQGIKLNKWDLNIFRGIVTGYNDAFIISKEQKDKLIAKDPKNAEILKPLLRGRDVKKYHANFADLWLIYLPWHFPLHEDENITGASSIAESEFEKQFPDLYEYMLTHKGRLSKRNKTETGIRYEWYVLQRYGSQFWQEFEKPKIIYPNMTKFLPFMFDKESYYTNQKCFIMTGGKLEYLVSFFNSKLFRFCFSENFPELQGNTKELNKVVFEQIPVKLISEEEEKPFIEKVNQILALKKANPEADTSKLESEIDQMVYKLYELTEEEIQIIEESVK